MPEHIEPEHIKDEDTTSEFIDLPAVYINDIGTSRVAKSNYIDVVFSEKYTNSKRKYRGRFLLGSQDAKVMIAALTDIVANMETKS